MSISLRAKARRDIDSPADTDDRAEHPFVRLIGPGEVE
jgi:hypothetical protein